MPGSDRSRAVLPDDRFPRVEVTTAAALWRWLDAHHDQPEGVWLVTYKKAVPSRHVTTDEVLDALVAHGWTDGIRRQLDAERTMQLISPRRAKAWAASYKARAERLMAAGRMHASGLAAVERARRSGGWEEHAEVDALVVPDDLREALQARDGAWEAFSGFPPSTRRNMLRWIALARTTPTRERRISRLADDAAQGIRTRTNG